MTDYEALKICEHSPAKALEITVTARHGDEMSIRWFDMVKSAVIIHDEEDEGYLHEEDA